MRRARFGWQASAGVLKPENALGRADQYIGVGQVETANQALYDLITDTGQGKIRKQWSKTYEAIMLKLMELSVDLRKNSMVKEALHKYRALASHSNVSSLEDVCRYVIQLAEKKLEEVRKAVADEHFSFADDDLEEGTGAIETPETLLLQAALSTGMDNKQESIERVNRQLVVPWMRFLWEIYRNVLDIVKTHAKLELCYHDVAKKAFAFCVRYDRFLEFRRLCDMLRQHVSNMIKFPRSSPNDVQLSSPETLQRFMDLRLTQFQSAVQLKHWQEAFRTIEDIHILTTYLKRTPKAQTLGIYYERLTQVFRISKNYLCHAHALYKLYSLSTKQNRNLSAADAKMMASKLVLAALSVPPYEAHMSMDSSIYGLTDVKNTFGEGKNRYSRMASLLGYSTLPDRDALISELISNGITRSCHENLVDLFNALENDMAPLKLAKRLTPILEFIESQEELEEYSTPVRRVAVFKLFQQLGRVYDVMHFEEFIKLCSFVPVAEMEKIALEALKIRALAVRFDHQNKCVRFESALFSTEVMRGQLSVLARRLTVTANLIEAEKENIKSDGVDEENNFINTKEMEIIAERRATAIKAARSRALSEQKSLLARKAIIEQRKEESERKAAEAEQLVKRNAMIERARREEAEKKRMEEESRRREIERLQKEIEEREKAELRKLKAEIDSKLGVDRSNKDEVVDEELNREDLLTKQRVEELKAQREVERKLVAASRRLDYTERALREAQRPFVKEAFQEESKKAIQQVEKLIEETIEKAKQNHQKDITLRDSTLKLKDDREAFVASILKSVNDEFDVWMNSEVARVEKLKKEQEEREKAFEEEERRKKAVEEEEKRRVEEEMRAEREADEKRAAAIREKQEEVDRQLQAQRQREEELERKLEAQRAAALGETSRPVTESTPVGTGAASSKYVPPRLREKKAEGTSDQRPSSDRYFPPARPSANSDGTGGSGGGVPGKYVPPNRRGPPGGSSGGSSWQSSSTKPPGERPVGDRPTGERPKLNLKKREIPLDK